MRQKAVSATKKEDLMTLPNTPDMWSYREDVASTRDIVGYSIEATDGDIGKVDKANNETGSSYLIVATGPWIFGRTVMLPAGVIQRIDHEDKVVHVNRSKEDIKNAPEYQQGHHEDEGYRSQLGGYYDSPNPGGPGSA
jgi:hypothetical protein